VRPGFFYRYWQATDRLRAASGRKEAERNRNVVADFTEDYARELEQRRLIEEQEKIENCWREGELRRRIADARIDIWYLPALAKNDVTKFEGVRQALYVDAVNIMEKLIEL
jgi:hypothetical protein